MTPKLVHFAARCPFCEAHHHKLIHLTDNKGQPVAVAAESFNCCGHEFGFSVRRTLESYLSEKGRATA